MHIQITFRNDKAPLYDLVDLFATKIQRNNKGR